jgi:hypothetical protein
MILRWPGYIPQNTLGIGSAGKNHRGGKDSLHDKPANDWPQQGAIHTYTWTVNEFNGTKVTP